MYLDLALNNSATKLFAVDSNSYLIDVFDLGSNSVTNSITLTEPAFKMIKHPSQDVAYIATTDVSQPPLARVAGRSTDRPDRIWIKRPAAGRSAGRSAAIVGGGGSSISQLDLSSETEVATVSPFAGYYSYGYGYYANLAISENNNELYVGDITVSEYPTLGVSIIDLSNLTEVAVIESGAYPYPYYGQMALDDQTSTLYVNNSSYYYGGGITSIDMTSRTVTSTDTMPLDGISGNIAIDYVNSTPYMYSIEMTDTFQYQFSVYDMSSLSIVCTASMTQNMPYHIGIFEPFHHVFITGSTGVEVFDGTDCSLATATMLDAPVMGMAANEQDGIVYISHETGYISIFQYAASGTVTPPASYDAGWPGGYWNYMGEY